MVFLDCSVENVRGKTISQLLSNKAFGNLDDCILYNIISFSHFSLNNSVLGEGGRSVVVAARF